MLDIKKTNKQTPLIICTWHSARVLSPKADGLWNDQEPLPGANAGPTPPHSRGARPLALPDGGSQEPAPDVRVWGGGAGGGGGVMNLGKRTVRRWAEAPSSSPAFRGRASRLNT